MKFVYNGLNTANPLFASNKDSYFVVKHLSFPIQFGLSLLEKNWPISFHRKLIIFLLVADLMRWFIRNKLILVLPIR